MKSNLSYLFLTIGFLAALIMRAQVNDDFSDGDFTNGTVWSGDGALFTVEDQVLRSNIDPGDDAINYYLSTASTAIDETQWEFWINLDFSTSGSNFIDVHIAADNPDLSASGNGYFIRFGGTPDEISFFKLSSGSESILIDGDDGELGSSSNIYKVRLIRTSAGLWTLELDEDDTGVFELAGSVTDNEITTTTYFGFQIEQSSAAGPVNSHFFDDILIGPIPVDDEAPELLSAEALSATEVSLQFSEALDQATAETLGNYTIDGAIGNPTAAVLEGGSAVSLTLPGPMTNGQEYQVTASGVEDLAGNATTNETATFTFFAPDNPVAGDVIFNEIFPDPSPVVGLPESEFIEIHNRTGAFFDVENWILVNTTTEKVLPSTVLPPNEYLILCDADDVGVFTTFGNVVGVSSFTALANGADSLTLIDADGEVLDIVSYTDDWYADPDRDDGGYSLERINPDAVCSGAFNWAASTDPSGGTPGAQNSVFSDVPDETAPSLVSFGFPQDNEVLLTFSEPLGTETISEVMAVFEPELAVAGIFQPAEDQLLIELIVPIAPGIFYLLELTGISDCPGNTASAIEVEILIGISPTEGDVLITEIMTDPSPSQGLAEGEYFELYNISETAIDLLGCSLSGVEFDQSVVLAPGQYAFFASLSNQVAFLASPEVIFLEDMSSTFLTNGGRELEFLNPNGVLIDRVNYDISWYNDPDKEDGGFSLERINLSEQCRGADNWTGSEADFGGTPGSQNSVFSESPDDVGPLITAVFAQSENTVEVLFSEVIDSLSVLLTEVSISPEIAVEAIVNNPPDYSSVSILLGEPLQPSVRYELVLEGITDCVGNALESGGSFVFALPQPAEPGDLLINEILFNPRTSGRDFVEIYNTSDKNVGLKSWLLLNGGLTARAISDDPIVIFPGQHLVLTDDVSSIIQEYPMSGAYRANFYEMESLPSFNNGDGSVILADSLENEFDRFDYLEDYHFPLLNTFDGVSLERLSYTRPTNDPGNWSSASERVGFATPGYRNSQFLPEGRASAQFELEDEIFSPDNDGFEDVLLINYVLDSPDYLATIRIFDQRGRVIKGLANNLLLGTDGTISWDGTTDDRSKARIGPHIILIEIFNPSGESETYKIPCIVAGNLSN